MSYVFYKYFNKKNRDTAKLAVCRGDLLRSTGTVMLLSANKCDHYFTLD